MPLSHSKAGQMPCSSKVCRNLFGPLDHEELQNDFETLLRHQLEEAQQRWNFDFETDTPLEGPFRWERVGLAEQSDQEVHRVPSNENRSSLGHKVPSKDPLAKVCPEGSQQSSELCRAGSLQSLKRGQATIKAEDAPEQLSPPSPSGLSLFSKIRSWAGDKNFYSSKRRIIHDKPNP